MITADLYINVQIVMLRTFMINFPLCQCVFSFDITFCNLLLVLTKVISIIAEIKIK